MPKGRNFRIWPEFSVQLNSSSSRDSRFEGTSTNAVIDTADDSGLPVERERVYKCIFFAGCDEATVTVELVT
jgi:hypothetical protein